MAVAYNHEAESTEFHPRSEEARHDFELTQPQSVDDLHLTRIENEQDIQAFLNQFGHTTEVGETEACFGATCHGYLVAIGVLGPAAFLQHVTSSATTVTHLCGRPDTPHNTGAWLLGKIRRWAILEGYDSLYGLADKRGYAGTAYERAGFSRAHSMQAQSALMMESIWKCDITQFR
jgi:hypothetical protein